MSRGLRRFFVDAIISDDVNTLKLSLRETFHLHRVLRLRPGDVCQIFNRNGCGAEAVVETVSETEGAKLQLKRVFPLKTKTLILKVGQSLPQKRKMDDLIKKAEELGVHELWVLETKRTIVKMTPETRERAKQRWERIVVEAAKQSGNPVFMNVRGPIPFKKVVEEKLERTDLSFLFHPNPTGLPFSSLIEKLRRPKQNAETASPAAIFLFFGPEGGFTNEEVHMAESRGVQKVFLGDNTLRLETAFLGVVSAIRLLAPQ